MLERRAERLVKEARLTTGRSINDTVTRNKDPDGRKTESPWRVNLILKGISWKKVVCRRLEKQQCVPHSCRCWSIRYTKMENGKLNKKAEKKGENLYRRGDTKELGGVDSMGKASSLLGRTREGRSSRILCSATFNCSSTANNGFITLLSGID